MFSIYVHVPYCRRRCPYCDFYLIVGRPNNSYVDALLKEWSARGKNEPAQTLYFGGGTPSLLDPKDINRFINTLFQNQALVHDAEITLEVNPEDLSLEYVKQLRDTPVNRISMGVQSFDDEILRFLGRKHDEKMAKDAINNLLHEGFGNISVDQIIGVPDEKPQKITADLQYLSAMIPHLSCYLLTVEEGTNFSKRMDKGLISPPDDDAQADAYELVQKTVLGLGYVQYDISSYAKPGYFSRHNQAYWGKGAYLGLGPGAHSLAFLPDGGLKRTHNRSDLFSWLKDPTNEQDHIIDQLEPKKALLESIAFGFRNMALGVNPLKLSERHGQPLPANFFNVLEKFKELQWLDESDGLFRISSNGALHADAIMREVLFS